ncbi:hypothetical protein N2W54_006186 [Lotmaria passim]
MIPVLNMNKIHRGPPGNSPGGAVGVVGQGSASRLHTSRQMSPRTPNMTSPRDATSSQASAHLTRRAAEVAPVLEMNPLQCQNVGELQRKLIETAEWVMRLRCYYAVQLQERDQWLDERLRDLEKFCAETVAAGVQARVAAEAATTNADSSVGNVGSGAPATISASKASLSGGGVVPQRSVSEAKTVESEKVRSTVTPPRHCRGRQQQQQQRDKELSIQSSSVSCSPQPSLLNIAQADTASVDVADSSSSSADRTRAAFPKKSEVVRIPQGRCTVSANEVRGSSLRRPGGSSPRPNSNDNNNNAGATTVDRGESRPTRAARPIAEKESKDVSSSGDDGAVGATRRRCPPALAPSRGASGLTDSSNGPRLAVLTTTVPTTTRPGRSALLDKVGSTHTSLSTRDIDRQRSGSSNSRRHTNKTPPPPASMDLSTTAPAHSLYLEAGLELGRESKNNISTTAAASASRANNGLNSSVGLYTEPRQGGRTPREGSSHFYLLGSGSGQPSRLHNASGPSQGSQRSASRGLSGQEARKRTSSGNASSRNSSARVHAL